jgi:hypothetical protein
MDEGLPAPIQNGGCGFWLVGGSTRMSLNVQKRPWCEKRCVDVHALVMIARASSKRASASSRGIAKPVNSF